ncbi:MAG: sulfotransferase [Porphyromonadaceae bacterium]|nr:sulfotransferase [Porphyromonadaceae bacterium]
MGFNFQKLPANTLLGADWKTFHDITQNRTVDKRYKTKYRITKILCRILSLTNTIENRRSDKWLADKPIENDPVFILGHWRSGTTFVHNVLSQDKQFGYTTTYQTVFPHMVLFGQPFFKKMAAMAMPKKRPADNMELKADQPQEEEFALMNMCPNTYYNFWVFPRDTQEYSKKYLLHEEATPAELANFKEYFERLVKISLWNTKGKRFLSKNPPHTGRIKALLELFPNAKFIYLMRNPYTVFESTRNFFLNTMQPLKLQDITPKEVIDNFIKVYIDLYFRYQEDKKLIPAGNLIEIKFEDFEHNPLEMVEKIYETLSLPGFAQARPQIENYINRKKGYKKNKYNYDPETVQIVEKNWDFALKDWGYKL